MFCQLFGRKLVVLGRNDSNEHNEDTAQNSEISGNHHEAALWDQLPVPRRILQAGM